MAKEEASKTQKQVVSKTPKQDDLLDRVISNITEDRMALKEQNELIDKAKSYKAEIVGRIKDLRRDLSTFVKYATDEQLERIKELDINIDDLGNGLNKVAQQALDILQKQTKGEATNGDLYQMYHALQQNKEDAESYTSFNIKCRSLFNSQRLIRIEPKDAKSSREHIIRINGFKPTTK